MGGCRTWSKGHPGDTEEGPRGKEEPRVQKAVLGGATGVYCAW